MNSPEKRRGQLERVEEGDVVYFLKPHWDKVKEEHITPPDSDGNCKISVPEAKERPMLVILGSRENGDCYYAAIHY